ncbi:MAG: YihA family ribosome biogenesis GTP-binding protein [Flavobacteriaceae bacterium]|nr:YihA family ribosome biogenesis GTP-binding protein [Flavobacteriaceae bacterium]|tara:strand:+ start:15808 stop:16407 length:600 start_codon:yes stop_codon:yes gene_type:complete
MQIINSKFLISNTDVSKCPNNNLPDYAFIGRSNVGKSSLINALCNNKRLALISSKPGKTQLINHYLINKSWHIVDLPGYGYALTSKQNKKKFQEYIIKYFLERKQMISAFLLIDIRIKPQKIDLEFINWLGEKKLPFSIVFTKSDKIKSKDLQENVEAFFEKMNEKWSSIPKYFITSSVNKSGLKNILKYIDELNKLIL